MIFKLICSTSVRRGYWEACSWTLVRLEARGAWLFFFFFFFNSGEGAAGGRTLLRGERSSCGAQMLNKRNRGAARAIKHPPRVLFTGQTGITAPPPPPPPPPANPGLTTLSHTCRQKVLATPPQKKNPRPSAPTSIISYFTWKWSNNSLQIDRLLSKTLNVVFFYKALKIFVDKILDINLE